MQCVAIDGKEILKAAVEVWLVKDAFHEVDTDVVADDSFFEETGDDAEDAFAKHVGRDNERLAYLGNEVACSHDGACYKLGEEADVKGIVEEV